MRTEYLQPRPLARPASIRLGSSGPGVFTPALRVSCHHCLLVLPVKVFTLRLEARQSPGHVGMAMGSVTSAASWLGKKGNTLGDFDGNKTTAKLYRPLVGCNSHRPASFHDWACE